MSRIVKTLTVLLIIAVGVIGAQAQTLDRYNIENTIIGFYFQYLCSEQGSLASEEQQKQFDKRGFYKLDFTELKDPFSPEFLENLHLLNEINGDPEEYDRVMWGDMDDADYFTLYIDNIIFSSPNIATVKAHIDYGVRKVPKTYKMSKSVGAWMIDDVSVTSEPLKFMAQYNQENKNKKPHKENQISDNKEETQIYNIAFVDEQPEFPGGANTMYNWIAENIQYPEGAFAEGVQGKVIVEFVIDESGNTKNLRVLRGRHPELDKEALRVVQSMPAWKPALVKGKAVSTIYTLPVAFKIGSTDSK